LSRKTRFLQWVSVHTPSLCPPLVSHQPATVSLFGRISAPDLLLYLVSLPGGPDRRFGAAVPLGFVRYVPIHSFLQFLGSQALRSVQEGFLPLDTRAEQPIIAIERERDIERTELN
jgi:hypothetical protein